MLLLTLYCCWWLLADDDSDEEIGKLQWVGVAGFELHANHQLANPLDDLHVL